ncbi:DUF1329 domain-containing protein [Hahella sp. CR1]|uniref:DUF1329 domain-containing protein n=1 Tax=Hahella sp. CR1 TaxID=2992807 RepID=UPI002442CA62|nr:DUF1329 domain-containing protein [Hahella sp. CR1]MDG9667508.1 DUF1329 domain-containing protein [Hahella sp. CR1]
MMQNKKVLLGSLLLFSLYAACAGAAVSPAEAKKLTGELTPFGAIREGNGADIPRWEGGITQPPKEYQREGQHHPDPFKEDKPKEVITAQNFTKYEKYLSEGLKALFKTYPTTFKIPVYVTRRSHSAPDWVNQNTYENAVKADLTKDGNGVTGAYGGIPFPVLHGSNERKALQAIWNHLTRWRGVFVTRRASETAVQRNGEFSLVNSQQEVFWNFYNPEGSEKYLKNILFYYLSFTISPARLAGGAVLVHETLDQVKEPRQAWGYNAGQRRVRRAPNLAYDSPIAASDNLRTADDTDMYNGAPDRYDWNYLGLKEMYIPYNSYQISQAGLKYADVLGVSHINPDYTRFEKHRVHVIEAKLKAGERHIYSRRVFYIDEDSWNIALVDQYDGRGELWRVSMAFLKNFYELPSTWTALDVFYDLQARRYHVQGLDSEERSTRVFTNEVPDRRYFSPQSLRRRGIR